MSTTANSAPSPTMLQEAFRLIYRSHDCTPPADRAAVRRDIFSTARANNKRAGVTGALLVTDHYFVQALEGDEASVRALFERIGADPRHEDVRLLDTRTVGERVFARWAMAEVSKLGGADIPLHSDSGRKGLSRAAARPSTPDQDSVLRFMRNSIGADTV